MSSKDVNSIVIENNLLVTANGYKCFFVPKGCAHLDDGILVISKFYKQVKHSYRDRDDEYSSKKEQRRVFLMNCSFRVIKDWPDWVKKEVKKKVKK